MYHVLDTLFLTKKPSFSAAVYFGTGEKTLQNAKYILHFSKTVVISFERGDIDVRPSHAKLILFFTFSDVSRIWHTFLVTLLLQGHEIFKSIKNRWAAF